MEISKGLQEEILTVQNKLKNAIRDHQICVGKLKDDPNNADILGQIQEIHLHIVALGRCQKQVVQRLRKEVEAFKAENSNGAKVTIASLLGLNNNNHITNNNETKHERRASVLETKQSKEDYEEIVRNGDVPSPPSDNTPPKERSASVETVSGEDDVIEVSMDENSNEKREDSVDKDCRHESLEKLTFLCGLGLITTARYAELQNKRAERKRRSTANPQFVYSSLEAPTKRKRYSYLQSANAPQTRQTTARMNGPSPPPNKISMSKASSPPTRNVTKSLIPVQKSTTRPNILRNVAESKVYIGKGKSDNGGGHVQLVATNVRPMQTISSKTVHIPGLPSSLTIERIESDSVVCITCRNPGTLTICESCSASYHLSCHTVSPAPQRMCPKCVENEDGQLQYKKDEELATTSHATGIVRKAGEDAEVYKTARGLYKADATQKKHVFSSSLGIGQLPSSTFLIPISPSSIPVTTINQSEAIPISVCSEQSESNVHYSSIVLNQLPRTSIAYVQSEPQVSYAYQLPVPVSNSQSEKHQSYLIVKKISESGGRVNQHSGNQVEAQALPAVLKYQLPATSSDNARIQSEISVTNSSHFVDKQHMPESTGRINKKSANRAVPALNRIVSSEKLSIAAEYDLERPIVNGRKLGGKRGKLGVNQLRSSRAVEIMLPNYDGAESGDQLQITKSSDPEEIASYGGRVKYKPRSGGLLHSLFSSHNKSYIVADRARESRRASSGSPGNDSDHQQQLHRQGQQLDPREQSAEREIRLQCRSLTKFFELVKLEEAHLPAPSRTKLVRKSGLATGENVTYANENSANEHARADRLNAGMVDDEPPMQSDGSDDEEEPRYSYWQPPRILGRRGLRGNLARRRSMESRDNGAVLQLKSIDPNDGEKVMDDKSSDRDTSDQKIIDQLKDSDTNASITCDSSETAEAGGAIVPDGGLVVMRRSASRDDGIENETAAPLRSAQSDLLQLRNEVSVPDDKAETERQDLSSGSRPTSSNSSTSSNDGSASSSDLGASSSSSIESVSPEKITADPTECSRQESLDDKCDEERLGISAVSLESMQVLEQFETAMLEADPGNSATC